MATMLGAYSAAQSDGMDYAGLDFQATSALALSYHLSRLDDIFWRSFAELQYGLPLGPGKAFADLRYFDARAQGRALAGEVDNRLFSSNLGYKVGGHMFSGGYQQSAGDTPFIYLNASDTYIFWRVDGEQLRPAQEFANATEGAEANPDCALHSGIYGADAGVFLASG